MWAGGNSNNCSDWTDGTSGPDGRLGYLNIAFGWDGYANSACNTQRSLLCMGTDHNSTFSIEPPTGSRLAFLSTTVLDGSYGIGGMGAVCQADFEVVYGTGTGRQFKAFAADKTISAADRFVFPDGPNWVRPDGIEIADSSADFLAGNWNVYNNIKLGGGFPSWAFSWTGSTSPGSGATDDCNGWSSNLSNDYGRVGSGSSFNYQFSYNSMSCNHTDYHLYCVED